jgi:hypothetical protein
MALKLGEVLNNLIKEETSRLIAEVVLEADTNTVTIPNLDINRDGGVYEVIVSGVSTINNSYFVEYNNVASDSNYRHIRLYNTGSTITSDGSNEATAGYMYNQSGLNIHTIALPNGHPTCITTNAIVSTTPTLAALYYSQSYMVKQQNITSLTFRLYSIDAQFKTGTIFKVYKK